MRHIMSLKARRELLDATALRYAKAPRKEKQTILDELTHATGYHRKYLIHLLNNYTQEKTQERPIKRKPRPKIYTKEVQEALIVVWEAAHRICSRRLVPFLPEIVPVLEKYGHLVLSDKVRARLLAISPSTVDRLLYKIRQDGKVSGKSTTRPGNLLKSQVAIRSFSDWDDVRPGFIEADLVAHCGTFVGGHFLQTLVMTDICTGWTEFEALLFRDQETVLQALERIREQMPLDLLGLDTDNGTEFLNYLLLQYCFDEEITFTRSRPYKKNDQCHVEEKNGSIIRKFIGYDRFEGIQSCQILSALYSQLRLYVNFFQPSMKLISKIRNGSRVIKKYDQAQTPCQRILASEKVSAITKQKLSDKYQELDPVHLLEKITNLQDQLWRLAYVDHKKIFESSSKNGGQSKARSGSSAHLTVSGQKDALLSSPKLEPADRMYRRTSKRRRNGQKKRWWRTRQDPFAEIWEEVQRELKKSPYSSAKGLFNEFQERYPGKFHDGQLRTFQRRVKDWRVAQVNEQIDAEKTLSTTFSILDKEIIG
jgi:hypothetical protein